LFFFKIKTKCFRINCMRTKLSCDTYFYSCVTILSPTHRRILLSFSDKSCG
jgi:hypothetical protein